MSEEVLLTRIVGLIAAQLESPRRRLFDEIIKGVGGIPHLLAEPEAAARIEPLYRLLRQPRESRCYRERIECWERQGVRLVAWQEAAYPKRLKEIFDPPYILFYQGELAVLDEAPPVGVVGARAADPGGCDIAHSFSKALAVAGGCVVSGLALGIDAAAHAGAIASGRRGATAAVLGNGLPAIYPAVHFRLASRIIENGGVLLSQFEPGVKPYPSNFLDRNRVIAGLSDGVLVVQASKRSGSLATARYALEGGREVMAIPGRVTDQRHEGTNALIKQGAHLVSCPEDICHILPALKSAAKRAGPSGNKLSEPQRRIVEVLRKEQPLHGNKLRERLPQLAHFTEELLELELEGVVRRLPGNMFEAA